jgi:hypothetical protein
MKLTTVNATNKDRLDDLYSLKLKPPQSPTHTLYRIDKSGPCEKCGTQTHCIILAVMVDRWAHWCGC